MIIDIVDDFIARCDKCHESTDAYMDVGEAVLAWENGKCTGRLDILEDDLEGYLSEIKSVYVSKEDFCKPNKCSCDCKSVIIDTGKKLILLSHEMYVDGGGYIECDELISVSAEYYYKVDLEGKIYTLEKAVYFENGAIDVLKYKSGDTYLFVFYSEYNLVLTKSKYDITDEANCDFPETEEDLVVVENY